MWQELTGSINSVMVIQTATGTYTKAEGSAGKFGITIQDIIQWFQKLKEAMTNKAEVNSLSDFAYFVLEGSGKPGK
jgi:hypothetical protein